MKKTMLVSACAVLAFSACARNEVPPDVTPEQIMTTVSETTGETETVITEEVSTEVITSVSSESEPVETFTDDKVMPEPFGAGCPRIFFHYPCVDKFHCLSIVFDEYSTENNFDLYQFCEVEMKMNRGGFDTSIEDFTNLYTYMNYFNISGEEMCELMKKSNAAQNWDNAVYDGIEAPSEPYTEEDMEVLLSGDITAITAHFTSPYSIVIGEKIYSPEWVYFHTAEDYEAVGITPEMLAEKAELYSDAGFEEPAKTAFEKKLSDYIGYEVDLTYMG